MSDQEEFNFSGLSSGQATAPVSANPTSVAPDNTSSADGYDFSGLSVANPEKAAEDAIQSRYGTLPQQGLAALEGGAQGVLGPLAPAAEIATGLTTGKDIRGRAEANPVTHFGSEAGTFAAASIFGDEIGLPGVATEGGNLLSKVVPSAKWFSTATAGELATLAASNELSKMVEGDPNQTLGSAAVNVGLSSLLGGVGGAAVENFNPFKAFARHAFDSKAKNIISNILGEGGALALGVGFGHLVGWPFIGGYIAERTLAPALTALAKPFAEKLVSTEAARAAFEYTYTAQAGKRALMNQITDLFGAGTKVTPAKEFLFPTQSVRNELIKNLQRASDPQNALQGGDLIAHYLPNHAAGLGELTAKAVNYFNSLKPQQPVNNPMDATPPISKVAEANYNRQLDNAQQPLMLLQHAKKGTLQPQDVTTIRTLYPGLHDQMIRGITEQIINNKNAAMALPYGVKNSLNLLIGGKALDSTMTPSAAQAIIKSQEPPQANQPQQKKGRNPSGAELSQVNKVNALYQTPEQARAAHRRK